jgi:redox-sensitive bicupin YhaK (pirin superfamily)
MNRTISRVERPVPEPGFLGEGHTAVPVIRPEQFERNDPFILLMDDRVHLKGDRPAGGPHPHAGFETVTLVLEGKLRTHDRNGEGHLEAGDVQWMTAGRGVIHTETMDRAVDLRILQLWLTLPKKDRWVCPASQDIRGALAPVRREPGAELRLYSGSSGGLKSTTRNHVPVTLAEIRLDPKASIEQDLDHADNGMVYGIEGSYRIEDQLLRTGEVGWLDRPQGKGAGTLRITAGDQGARLVLYAGRMQHEPIVHYGPFVGDTNEDIVRAYQNYRAGHMGHINALRQCH